MTLVPPIVLASASSARAKLLTGAGLSFRVQPADVDEAAIKASLAAQGRSIPGIAEALAERKAVTVSQLDRARLVIGADQVLDCEGLLFDKPADVAAARRQLEALRGRTHALVTAACIARDGAVIWLDTASARMTMRPFSDCFLDAYLEAAGPELTHSVGAYALEGIGAQLFSRIEGDFFVVLGLPLLALLDALRENGALLS